MRPRVPPPQNELAGSLLLAHPALRDENFRRTVILLSAHGEDGAMGLVLNRPLGKTLAQFSGAFALGPLADIPLYHGGPVKADQLLLCAWRVSSDGHGLRLFFGLEPEKAVALKSEPGVLFRAFLGYSGWSGGQLEDELRQNAWVVTPLVSNILELEANDALWRGLLGSLNHEWKLLADEPEDPSEN